VHTGGCQCGRIRFRVEGELGQASICHCRMCQKAFGAFFAPLVSIRGAKLEWTKDQPQRFASSNFVKRGFCSSCGTPLSYEAPDGTALAIGAFDKPQAIVPSLQYGAEARLKFMDHINEWPLLSSLDDLENAPFLNDIVPYQHPDHD
jgi:hypothetical protein